MNIEYRLKYITPDIKLSSFDDRLFKTELMFEYHMLVWFISGETKIIQADAEYIFGPGDIFLIPRNQLATIINYPKNGQPHKAVVMHLTAEKLKQYYAANHIKPNAALSHKIRSFQKHPLLESCLASLIPYFEMQDNFPEDIASLKITEAITILRKVDKEIDGILGNFEEPGKADLISFMEKNFMFNMSMEKFSYLTGRSLSSFKRDFKKTFHTTPQKWLTQKRLELAHYQFTEKKKKPVDVYFEVGFENLSHFSHAFRKHFGYSPASVVNGKA